MLSNYISPYNAAPVEKLISQFSIPCLKANMDEFGMGSSMLNSAFGSCFNPWSNLDFRKLSPGGSSGASAVAVGNEIMYQLIQL